MDVSDSILDVGSLFFFNDIPRSAYLYHLLGQRGVIKECTIVRIPNIFSRVFIHNSNAHWNYNVIETYNFIRLRFWSTYLSQVFELGRFDSAPIQNLCKDIIYRFPSWCGKNLKIPTRKKKQKKQNNWNGGRALQWRVPTTTAHVTQPTFSDKHLTYGVTR